MALLDLESLDEGIKDERDWPVIGLRAESFVSPNFSRCKDSTLNVRTNTSDQTGEGAPWESFGEDGGVFV